MSALKDVAKCGTYEDCGLRSQFRRSRDLRTISWKPPV